MVRYQQSVAAQRVSPRLNPYFAICSKVMKPTDWAVEFASDSSLLLSWTGEADGAAAIPLLLEKLAGSKLSDFFVNLHPAYRSLLVDFDPIRIDPNQLCDDIQTLAGGIDLSAASLGNLIEVPTVYGGEAGPDLADVANSLGLSESSVIELHAGVEYRVSFLGFAPGFPYLEGLPEKLFCARLEVPRLKVPKGSVAIGGAQTGIYPAESPGGWRLIGRTELELFDPKKSPPTLFHPGARVRFVPIRPSIGAG
jgi:KipI family sensor histidine kinase inhibitor